MITVEECRYYRWLGRFFRGDGEAVELGCWLGRSTFHVVHGLRRSEAFAGRTLHVVDDFVWRSSWMDAYYPSTPPANHTSFRALFDAYTASISDHLAVRQARICAYEGNDGVADLRWDGRPIELLFVDCGRTLEANEAWFSALSPWFIRRGTLVVMQDWQTYKAVPPRLYNQTKAFTDGHAASLELVHELRHGSVGTFLYTGQPGGGTAAPPGGGVYH